MKQVNRGKQRLDTALGRITMYRLILAVLATLTAAAALLSITGVLAYRPLELVLTLVVALGATVLSNAALSRLLRRPVSPESALITGLLLFFLFQPTADGLQLLGVALAGVIAAASKFVLAVRGRHVFNPAAAGALLVALSGLNFAVWWVATPYLLPVVVLGGFVLLYRTGQLPTAAIFVAISTAIVALRLSDGAAPGAALLMALSSFPILFLAAFMLSEPLTLPPRRWQQLLVAGIVAVLVAVPFSLGPLYSSPELALLAGNLVAFCFGQRRGLRLIYRGNSQLTPTSYEFRFEPTAPVKFRPGQYMELTLPHRSPDARGMRRMFSITSTPDDGEITFGLRVAEPLSSFKRTLLELPAGTVVSGSRTGGDFTLPRDQKRPLLLIGAGIGITPFLSQLNHLPKEGGPDVVLLYVIKSAEEFAYAEQLRGTGAKLLLLAPEPPEALAETPEWMYLGPGPVSEALLREAVADIAARTVFVSGSPANVEAARSAAKTAGARKVKTDAFAGY